MKEQEAVEAENARLQSFKADLDALKLSIEKERQELETHKFAVENRKLDILLEKQEEHRMNSNIELEDQNRQLRVKINQLQLKISELQLKDRDILGRPFTPPKQLAMSLDSKFLILFLLFSHFFFLFY